MTTQERRQALIDMERALAKHLSQRSKVTGCRELGPAKLPSGVYSYEQLVDVAAYLEQFR